MSKKLSSLPDVVDGKAQGASKTIVALRACKSVFLLFVLCVLAPLVFIFWLPFKYLQNPPYVHVVAESEYVAFHVANAGLSRIAVRYGKWTEAVDCEGLSNAEQDIFGLLEPAVGTTVVYRWFPDLISITVVAPQLAVDTSGDYLLQPNKMGGGKARTVATLTTDENLECQLDHEVRLVIPTKVNQLSPLPINGPMQIGVPMGWPAMPRRSGYVPAGIMYGATMQVFGRSITNNELYLTHDEPVRVAGGGSLMSGTFDMYSENMQREEDTSSRWYGMATLGKRGFDVSVTVDTNDLVINRAGGTAQQKERFGVSYLAEALRDPGLARWLLLFIAIPIVLQMLVDILSLIDTIRRRSEVAVTDSKVAEDKDANVQVVVVSSQMKRQMKKQLKKQLKKQQRSDSGGD